MACVLNTKTAYTMQCRQTARHPFTRTGASPRFGVARGGLSIPLLPEVVSEIDANPASLYETGRQRRELVTFGICRIR